MKIVSHFRGMTEGDVLITQDRTLKLCNAGSLSSMCASCAARGELCAEGAGYVCGALNYFRVIKPTEEIEQARDLFALKGELL